jgi:hypothetical protein
VIISAHPASTRRGVSRSSRTLEAGMRWTRGCSARSRADEGIFSDGQAVWSRPPDAGDKPCETIVARRRGPTSPEPRGEHGATVKTIAQGMSDALRCPVCSCASHYSFAHETAGAARTRHSLRPPEFERGAIEASPGHFVPRERGVVAAIVVRPILRDAASAAPQDEDEQAARCQSSW